MKTFAMVLIFSLSISCAVKSTSKSEMAGRIKDLEGQIVLMQLDLKELDTKVTELENRAPPVFRFAPIQSKKEEPEIEEPEPPPPPPEPREHVETEKALIKTLQEIGFTCKVIIEDANGNNIPDYQIACLLSEPMKDEMALLFITGAIADITKKTSWKSDMVGFALNKDYSYIATTRDCRRCVDEIAKIYNDPLKQIEVANVCISQIWTKIR